MRVTLFCLVAMLGAAPLCGQAQGQALHERFVVASDGTRLHMLEGGPATANTILFVPGWTMPAWIWTPQLRHFARHYHVVAFDPRGQGGSDVPATGYDHVRRARDMADVTATLGPRPILVVAWSLAVLETLAYVKTQGDSRLAGLVLVDNSVGEDPPPPSPPPRPPRTEPPPPHAESMRRFVRGMFRHPQDPAWLDRLWRATLKMPEASGKALLAYPVPRTYWREALYATGRPLLYVVRPRWEAQARNLARNRPGTEIEIFQDAGHALFIDEPARFNALLDSFIRRRVWP